MSVTYQFREFVLKIMNDNRNLSLIKTGSEDIPDPDPAGKKATDP
jgi:hypothetical protein